MPKTNWGRKWVDFQKGFPRLFLHEKHERLIRWIIRLLTAFGITTSVVTLPWQWSLLTSLALVGLDVFLERTLFYYTSLYIHALMEDYDPEEWLATSYISIGEPENPASRKIVGLVFKTEEYAQKFFNILNAWNGSDDHIQKDLRLTFVIDERRYYVYLYPDIEKDKFKQFRKQVERKNQLSKFGKQHFALTLHMTICKGFDTAPGFALGMFLDTTPPGREFLLAPFVMDDNTPRPIEGIDPILMKNYKKRIPFELTQDDFEYFHWFRLVAKGS